MKKVRKCVLFAVFVSVFAGQISAVGQKIHTISNLTIEYSNKPRLVTVNDINALAPKNIAFTPLKEFLKQEELYIKYHKRLAKDDRRLIKGCAILATGISILYVINDGSKSYTLTVVLSLAQHAVNCFLVSLIRHPINKKKVRSLRSGANTYMALYGIPRLNRYYRYKYQTDPMHKEIKTIAEKALSKLCMHPEEIILCQVKNDSHSFSSIRTQRQKLILVNEKFIENEKKLSDEEIEFVIGHEYSHIAHNDFLKRSLIYLITPIAVEYSFLLCDRLIQSLLNKLEEHLPKDKTLLINRAVVNCKDTSQFIATSPVVKLIATHFIMLWIMRKQEIRCDLESARALGKAQPGIKYFIHFRDKTYQQLLDKHPTLSLRDIKLSISLVGILFDEHPSEDYRIARLQKLSIEELGGK